jgi:SSS family solute:Na+ symporter
MAIVSAAFSTASAIYHIATLAVAEDLPARRSTRLSWAMGTLLCVLISASCANISGQLIAMLCTTSWSIVGSTVLTPYLALVLFNRRNARAAWCSATFGLAGCLFWYLCVSASTALMPPLFPVLKSFPPFFAGFCLSLLGWGLGSLRAGDGVPAGA